MGEPKHSETAFLAISINFWTPKMRLNLARFFLHDFGSFDNYIASVSSHTALRYSHFQTHTHTHTAAEGSASAHHHTNAALMDTLKPLKCFWCLNTPLMFEHSASLLILSWCVRLALSPPCLFFLVSLGFFISHSVWQYITATFPFCVKLTLPFSCLSLSRLHCDDTSDICIPLRAVL